MKLFRNQQQTHYNTQHIEHAATRTGGGRSLKRPRKRNARAVDTEIQTGATDLVTSPTGSAAGAGQRLHRGPNFGRTGRLRTGSTSGNANAIASTRGLSATYGSPVENDAYANYGGRAGLMISSKIDPEAARAISNSISSECLNAHRIKQHHKDYYKQKSPYNSNLLRKPLNNKISSETQYHPPTASTFEK